MFASDGGRILGCAAVTKLNNKKALIFDPNNKTPALLSLLDAEGWKIDCASNISNVRERLAAHNYSVGLASCEGFDEQARLQMEEIFRLSADVEWIALTPPEFSESPEGADLIHENFYDYHTLPVDRQRLIVTLGRAYGMSILKKSLTATQNATGRYGMIGASTPMHRVFDKIKRFAQVDAPVLILGESGTGKELAARAIHCNSVRGEKPFVAVNCSAMPGELVQSQLFGHEKGAFTGAHARQIGLIEAAQRGTIFLDEIGDLPFPQQGNLLRFLEEKEFVRVGGHKPIHADTRVIAATNCDLKESIERGTLRADLYFRINGIRIQMPPLRDRRGDIELLARYYFEQFSSEKRRQLKGIGSGALHAMDQYSWPGNVRELMNVVRHAMILSDKRMLQPEDLGLIRTLASGRVLTLARARSEAEIRAVREAVRFARRNISQAAQCLNISRVTLYRLIRKYGIIPKNL